MDAASQPSLEVQKFFQEARGRGEHRYKVLEDNGDSNIPPSSVGSDRQILNSLPYGREYSKVCRNDDSVVWQLRKALDHQLMATVTVKPIKAAEGRILKDVFDPNTLGRWALIPGAYRAYWSFESACAELRASLAKQSRARELTEQIEAYLADGNAPPHVCRALNHLRLRAALETGDSNCVWRPAQAAVAFICQDDPVRANDAILELGRMSAEIEAKYPGQTEERLRPLVRQLVIHFGTEITRNLNKSMTVIEANRWRTYARILLAEIRTEGIGEAGAFDGPAIELDAPYVSEDAESPDPCEVAATASATRYMALLNTDPPRGSIDMSNLRRMLEQGLAQHYAANESEAKGRVVDEVLRSIRLIIGEGPFVGDPIKLARAIEDFAERFRSVYKTDESLDATLATLLGLSFCDISTGADHQLLRSQFHALCVQFQSQIEAMMNERELSPLVSADEVASLIPRREEIFRKHVEDPLCPVFKFPWTINERADLSRKASQLATKLTPLFDEMALKVRYGGVSPQLKERMMREISQAAAMLPWECTTVRHTPYPNTQFVCPPSGLVMRIDGLVYREGHRPRETFRAMKYFHLGHRLKEFVTPEAELTRPKDLSPETGESER